MSEEELIHAIALTQVPGIGPYKGKILINMTGSATEAFRQGKVRSPKALLRAEKEYAFAQKNNIRCLTLHDSLYPSRLRECDDAPLVLFYKGDADLNAPRVISMVGTRNATEYGKQLCMDFLKELSTLLPDVLVVSGLAYGIDINCHRAALDNGLRTIGVLAHGLDRIYPAVHRKTAVEMVERGGLLTEFLTTTNPDRYNFVSRNRIVAGVSDATIVVESATKGGSLITAEIAEGYHRDCFAFPGRVTDELSQGCNKLIRDNKATLIQSAGDFIRMMNWDDKKPPVSKHIQRQMFPELSAEEQSIVSVLQKEGNSQINHLVVTTDIAVHRINTLLFELEMKGVVRVLAGGMYQLL